MSIIRRLAAALAASGLLAVLWLAWQARPPLPRLPRSLSDPLAQDEIGALLALLAWAAFVLLDVVLLVRVVEFGARRYATRTELRLKRALEFRREPRVSRTPPDWRTFARAIEPPVLRVAAAREPVAAARAHSTSPEPQRAAIGNGDGEEPETGSRRIAVRVLGPFRIEGAEADQPQRKAARELIAYLSVQPHGATRDELLETLWPDDDPRRSEQRFWQASTEARRALNGGLRRERGRYTLDRDRVTVDLDELESLFAEAADSDDGDEARRALERALSLFRGEPFDGIETAWAEGEGRRLRALAVDVLERLARLRLDVGEATSALDAAERGIALDLLNEGLWRLALEAEGVLGLREAVAERYETLCQLLDERLGLKPTRETRALYRELLGQA